ncbi:MAG: hypothetical protein OEX19_17780, partial [Gammaproteobacteria bacterium]|nr:hypothetical protein [Gammaproteobacteria bacterium]
MLRTKGGKRYGLELTRFSSGEEDVFISAGIVLEQRLFNWFNMSIGTIGYFDYQKTEHNPVGLTTNLGWEPDNY